MGNGCIIFPSQVLILALHIRGPRSYTVLHSFPGLMLGGGMGKKSQLDDMLDSRFVMLLCLRLWEPVVSKFSQKTRFVQDTKARVNHLLVKQHLGNFVGRTKLKTSILFKVVSFTPYFFVVWWI